MDVSGIRGDAVFWANPDALVAIDAPGGFYDVRAPIGGEEVDGLRGTDAAAKAAVDASAKFDDDGHC